MQNKKILITGGLGFIFSHVTEYFMQNNSVTIIDNLSDGSRPELLPIFKKNNVDVVKKDITDIDQISKMKKMQFDIIIHAAAESNVDKSIEHQKAFISSNITGTYAMLEYAKQQQKLENFIYVNTDEVYGSSENWKTEKDILNPSNPYSATKAGAGHLCWAYHNTYGLPIKEIRMCNIIGQRQATTKLLPRLIDRIKNNEPMPLYDGGEQTREYMDVRDVSPLIKKVIEHPDRKIFNLTFNQELSIKQVVQQVEAILNKKANLIDKIRLGHDKRYRMTPNTIMFNDVSHKLYFIKINETIKWVLSQ